MTDILIPDIGNFESVDVIEILVKPGDHVNKDDPLITLESDKASMDIPASESGIIKEIKVSVGDKVKQGVAIATFEAVSSEVNKKDEKKSPEITTSKEVQKKIISEPSRPFPEPPLKKYNLKINPPLWLKVLLLILEKNHMPPLLCVDLRENLG